MPLADAITRATDALTRALAEPRIRAEADRTSREMRRQRAQEDATMRRWRVVRDDDGMPCRLEWRPGDDAPDSVPQHLVDAVRQAHRTCDWYGMPHTYKVMATALGWREDFLRSVVERMGRK